MSFKLNLFNANVVTFNSLNVDKALGYYKISCFKLIVHILPLSHELQFLQADFHLLEQ